MANGVEEQIKAWLSDPKNKIIKCPTVALIKTTGKPLNTWSQRKLLRKHENDLREMEEKLNG